MTSASWKLELPSELNGNTNSSQILLNYYLLENCLQVWTENVYFSSKRNRKIHFAGEEQTFIG